MYLLLCLSSKTDCANMISSVCYNYTDALHGAWFKKQLLNEQTLG